MRDDILEELRGRECRLVGSGPYYDKKYDRWKIVIKYREGGKIITRSVSARTEAQAKETYEAVKEMLATGLPQRKEEPKTVGDLVEAMQKELEGVKTVTRGRAYIIDCHIRMLQQVLKPPTLSLTTMARRVSSAYADYCSEAVKSGPGKGQEKKARTKLFMANLLHRAFAIALRKKWVVKNPMEEVKPDVPGKLPRPKRLRLTVREALTLWAYARQLTLGRAKASNKRPDWRMGVAVALMLGGLRSGEVIDAQVRGLDQWGTDRTVLRLFDGKTESAERNIPVYECAWLLDALLEMARGRAPTENLFTTPYWSLYASAQVCCRWAGVTCVGGHALRRTFSDIKMMVTNQALSTLREVMVSGSMGHGHFSTTELYLSPEMQMQDDARTMGSVFRFLESGGQRSDQPTDRLEKMMALVERLGGIERAESLLGTVSTPFLNDTSEVPQRRKN